MAPWGYNGPIKNRLSHYLRRVQAGEHVQITDRGKLVVEIVPPGHATPELDLPATILALAHRGLHTLAPDRSPYSYHRPGTPLLRSGTAEELLNEERAE